MLIRSGHDLQILISRLLGEQHNAGWACPWCEQLGVYELDDKSTSDRLFVSTQEGEHPLRFVCRQASDGLVQHHPVHNVEELFSEFAHETLELAPNTSWQAIASEFKARLGVGQGGFEASKAFWSKVQVLVYHQNIATYEEWAKVGVSSEVVDRLRLGFNGRLTIPIDHLVPDPEFGMYPDGHVVQRTRRAEGRTTGPKYHWPKGLPPSLWYIRGEGDICYIVEGDTSAIAMAEIYPDRPVAMAPGGGNWQVKFSEYLLARGHTTFFILSDHDEMGRKYQQDILLAFKEAADRRGTNWSKLTFKAVIWPDDAPEKYDPRQVLLDHGVEKARELLDYWLSTRGWYADAPLGRVRAEYDEDYARTLFPADLQRLKDETQDLEFLRGPNGIYHEIADFVENYAVDDEGNGQVFLIRSTPGVGKTRSAVRYAEEYALRYLAKRKRRAEVILKRLREKQQPLSEKDALRLEKYEKEQYKKLSIVFVGKYVDGFDDLLRHALHPELWHNFEARNSETCQQLPLTQSMINAGYGVMKTCCIEGGLCPVREACHGYVDGVRQYMRQLDEVEQYPIIYVRHNHLYMKSLLKHARVVIVDEDPSSVALSPVTLTLDTLQQFDAYTMLEGEEADVVNRFMEAFIEAVATYSYDHDWLMDRALMDSCRVTRGTMTFPELATYIVANGLLDKIATWKPYNPENAPDGRIVGLLALLTRDALRTELRWNGQIFVQGKTVTYYTMEPFDVNVRTPIVALDATGMQHKYHLMFNRPTMEYRAEVFPKNLLVHTVIDSETTMTTLHKGLDKEYHANEPTPYGQRDAITLANGRLLLQDFSSLYDVNKVPNPALREVIHTALGLTMQHSQLLVVTYKQARHFIENFIREEFPNFYPYMAFGHFRALRGLNTFETMPAALIAGTFRMPYEVMARDLIAYHKNDPDPLDLKIQRVDEYYHGTPWRYSTITMADSRQTVQDYVYEMEAGELQQVAGRIRGAVSNETKYLYFMTARPAMPFTSVNDRILTDPDQYDSTQDKYFSSLRGAGWWWWQAKQYTSYIQHFVDLYGHLPTVSQLEQDTGQSKHYCRKMLESWKIENSP